MATYEYHNAGNSEAQEKVALSRLFAPDPDGVRAATGVLGGLVVSQTATASGSVHIVSGSAVVHPTMYVGASLLVNDSGMDLDIFTTNPMGGLPRNDIVVFDSLTATIMVIVGTPNATPTDPTVPATSVALARLRHLSPGGIGATTIPTAQIDDLIVATTLAPAPSKLRAVTPTASGNLNVGSVNLAASQTTPASPFGGTPYRIRVSAAAAATVPTGGGFFLDVKVDGNIVATSKAGNTGATTATLHLKADKSVQIADALTHTVLVVLTASGGAVNVYADASQWLDIELLPSATF